MGGEVLSAYGDQAIALVGIGCRFPGGVSSTNMFWDMLANGTDAIVEIPADRWDRKTYYHENRSFKGKTVSQYGGFIDGVDQFDPQFFGITPREAPFIDPQQRLLLEVSWEAMEDAGLVVERQAGRDVGVFMGAFTLDYKILQFGGSSFDMIDLHTATGSMMTLISNRISYVYDFTGPSMTVDTACSSSLVTTHLACQSIRSGECSMALAGGVLLNLAPQYTIAESQGGFLSADGRCKTFDAGANGYVRGEGVGVVVLKRLADAVADRDSIYAVILGSAVNQDGHTSSITVPSPVSQTKVIRAACAQARVDPAQIQYFEMHGTGTSVGDPLEAQAVGGVLSEGRDPNHPFYAGSLKTNIGHLEGAAGVAALIKTSLCLKHRQIPPHLNLHALNPAINPARYHMRIPDALTDWPAYGPRALAGVNGFGFGGTNASVVMTQAPESVPIETPDAASPLLYCLSARAEDALRGLTEKYDRFLSSSGPLDPYDLGYSMAFRRDHHDFRLAVAADNAADLGRKLTGFLAGEKSPAVALGVRRKKDAGLVFVYTGMGPQWWKMGRTLLETEEVFRQTVLRCDEVFGRYAGWSLYEALTAEESSSAMGETRVAQPANFALQVALTALWRSKGFRPAAIVGHSAGEIAAFYEAGVMSFEDAIKLVYYRSALQHELTGLGKMLAVGLDHRSTAALIADRPGVDIVAVNSHSGVTLVGDLAALEAVAAALQAQSVFNKFLDVNVPFHSRFMERIRERFLAGVAGIAYHSPATALYSTVTGRAVTGAVSDDYWWDNIRRPVLFADAVSALLDEGYTGFLEIGPHPALSRYIKEIAGDRNADVAVVSSLHRRQDERDTYYGAVAALYANGYLTDWTPLYPAPGNYVKLPGYAWCQASYWRESEAGRRRRLGLYEDSLLGLRAETVEPIWETELKRELVPFLEDHQIQGNVVFPAAGYLEMAMQAAKACYGDGFFSLREIEFVKATFVNPQVTTKLQLHIGGDRPAFSIYAVSEGHAHLAARGSFRQGQNLGRGRRADVAGMAGALTGGGYVLYTKEAAYRKFGEMGFDYQNRFACLEQIWVSPAHVAARLVLPDGMLTEAEAYKLHPGILDACFQTVVALGFTREGEELRLPVGVGEYRVCRPPAGTMWIHCRLTSEDENGSLSDISLYGEDGRLIAFVGGFAVRPLGLTAGELSPSALDRRLYRLDWVEKARAEGGAAPGLWVLLADGRGFAAALARHIRNAGGRCLLVERGPACSLDIPGGRATVRGDVEADFSRVYEACGAPVQGIVHCWNLDAEANERVNADILRAAADVGLYSLLHTIRAFIADKGEKNKLWIVTGGAQTIGPDETGQMLQNPVWGMARLIGNQEYTGNWGGIVDVDPTDLTGDARLFYEEIMGSDGEDQIAYRRGRRYVARLNNIQTLPKPLPVTLSSEHCYLVTGAFGALGQLATRWLVARGARQLALLGRTPLPDRAQWERNDLSPSVKARVDFVRALEEAGAQVHIGAADMRDKAALDRFFDALGDTADRIRGVISTAGVVRDALIGNMTNDLFHEVFDSKAIGNWRLHERFQQQELDFFVLYSSVASMITSAGQANYAAANAFLDALAQYRRDRGLAALSILWGPWAEGMIKDLHLEELYVKKGMTPLTGESGDMALQRLLRQDIAYAVVLEADWKRIIESGPRSQTPYLDHLDADAGSDVVALSDEEILKRFQEAYLRQEETARQAYLEEKLLALVGRVLHLPPQGIRLQNSLSELGMDSMLSMELRNRVELNLGVNVPIVNILNNQSIADLVSELSGALRTTLGLDTMEELLADISEDELQGLLDELEIQTDAAG
ncbi:MAG: acyltransferase domain-containing protein [Oscillospiraceae bacterium]|jgi:hybrid polyketide synthase/nonribosomal peptide synthetase FtdB|nr:acyltransferase domain-containing protein [Oscillospiraceae bacterium]